MYSVKINPIHINQNKNRNVNTRGNENTKFSSFLKTEIHKNQNLKFSKHALERLQERKIELSSYEVEKLDKAITKASEKGIKETLIIMDNKAFIASVPNRTVITASTDNQLKDNIFTNIDGAVFA